MRASAPPLMAIFRSQLQGALLARVLLHDDKPSIADLARDLESPLPTVAREVGRLRQAGILEVGRHGRAQLVAADETNPATGPLRDLLAVTFGPRFVVADEFSGVEGLVDLAIFGSWAARYRGVVGPVPGDVDVLVVGDVDRDEVYDVVDKCARRLRREVNPTIMSVGRWVASDADPFVQELRRRPLVPLSVPGSLSGPALPAPSLIDHSP